MLTFLPLLLCSCGRTEDAPSAFSEYIKAYTGGIINENSSIRIEFTAPVPGAEAGAEADARLFSFSPSLKGSAIWNGSSILEFIPENLQQGTTYKASVRLDRIIHVKAAKDIKKFNFQFSVASKEASLDIDHILVSETDPESADIYGTISFSSQTDPEDVRNMLKCTFGGKTWQVHISQDKASDRFSFTFEGLPRPAKPESADIIFDGKEYGFRNRQKVSTEIPDTGSFHILEAKLNDGADPYIDIRFSDPLPKDFNPDGFITLSGAGRYYTKAEDNSVKLYYDSFNADKLELAVSSKIRNAAGSRLLTSYRKTFTRESLKPAVTIPLKGTIMPDTDHLILPFRAVSLSAVDLHIIKIYESNALMFLQDNSLSESSSLRRSGRLIYKKHIRLDTDPGKDLHGWQDFSIDLSGLLKQEPGAIYRIRLSFRQEYSLYGNQASMASPEAQMINLSSGEMTAEDEAVWDEPYPYYYYNSYDWEKYRWKDRDNPAAPSYYMVSERFPECNLMASRLGIVVKSAESGNAWITVSDIMTAGPVSGADVTVYNYQLRPIGSGKTDKNGFLDIKPEGKAFAVKAQHGQSISYIKVIDGYEKSLSRFDTGGQKVTGGIKGFVYGERGVWRPGDTLHITLMTDDREHTLPQGHPATMELYNPLGQFYAKQVNTQSVKGLYTYHIPTSQDDPTGTWNAYFKVGGATFHKALAIETIRPNRLKINLGIKDKILSAGQRTTMDIKADWLTGPAASGLKANVDISLGRNGTSFKDYPGYTFVNPLSKFTSSTSVLLSTTLDSKGASSVQVTLPAAENAPGMMTANLICRVSEPGGDESIITESIPFSPYSSYVGIMLPGEDDIIETDTDHRFKTVTTDKEGRKIKGHTIEYRIYRIDWKWWWESRSDMLDSYINSTDAQIISKGTIKLDSGEAEIPFRISYPDWGRYLVYVKDLDSGHSCGGTVYADWPSWRGRSGKTDPDGLTMLTFSTDRKSYGTGDEATVYIPSSENGRALVSIENATGVISREWVSTSADLETPYRFRVTEDMAPNFYVHITLLQPHGSTANDLPIRMYGVQPVSVENKASHLTPVISAPEVIRPQKEFTVKVREKNGRPMAYTIAIVDEGLLDLTSFKTPDPWKAMYAREALGVKTWDLFDDVVGAFSGRFSPLFSVGGDETINHNAKKDNRFNPAVKFLGPFTLKGSTENTHKVTLSMYVGSVRIMVVACSEGAFGSASETRSVRNPLMVLSSLPRVLGTNEEVSLPVNVFAMEDGIRNVKVSASASGPVEISGPEETVITFSEPGDRLAGFRLRTTGRNGNATITLTAEGNGHSAQEKINIRVRNPEPAVTSSSAKVIGKGEEAEFTFTPFKSDDTEWAELSLTSFPAIDFNGCFSFVSDYRHYCTEQLVSKGLTMLYLKNLVSDENAESADMQIPEILKLLYSRQLPDGGFTYWPGNTQANEWVSSMAGHFMTEAASKGYEVNKGALANWKNFQKRCVRNYRTVPGGQSYDLIQAYRLYTLALASAPETGAMNRMLEDSNLSEQAMWRLAAAYAISGNKNAATGIIGSLKADVTPYSSTDMTFGSPLRDIAMYIETYVLADDIASAMKLSSKLAEELDTDITTQTTAFASVAMGRLSEKANTGALKATVNSDKAESAKSVYTKSIDTGTGEVNVRNLSGGDIYAVLTTRRQPAPEEASAASSGLSIRVSYSDLSGEELDPQSIRQGTDFTATVTVSNTSGTDDYTNLALSLRIPSGWEIFNTRLFGNGQEDVQAHIQYNDIRDDMAVYYFNLPKGKSATFTTRLHAAYQGTFIIPSAVCEAMYDTSVYARTSPIRTSVTK